MTKEKPKESEPEKAATIIRPTYPFYILHLIHKSWPKNELELVKAHYTAKGVKAYIRDLNDNQEYVLEIYPEESVFSDNPDWYLRMQEDQRIGLMQYIS